MRTFTALLCLAGMVAAATATADLLHLVMPQHDGSRLVSHSISRQLPSGHKVHLSAEGELANTTVCLDLLPTVRSVACLPNDELVVAFRSAADAASAVIGPDTVLTAGAQWGCINTTTGHPMAVHARVVSAQVSGAVVRVATAPAAIHDIFKHLRMRFHSNMLSHSETATGEDDEDAAAAGGVTLLDQRAASTARRVLHHHGFFHHIGHDIHKAVQHIGHAVKKVVSKVGNLVSDACKVVSFLLTGKFQYTGTPLTKTIGWNFDTSSGAAKNPRVNLAAKSHGSESSAVWCQNCYAYIQGGLHIEVDVESYHMKHFMLRLDGQAALSASAHGQVKMAWTENLGSIHLADVHLPTVSFAVGPVPIVITTHVPISAKLNIQVTAEADVRADGSVAGSVQYGVQHDGSDWTHIENAALNKDGGLCWDGAEIDATLTAGLQMDVLVDVDKLGHLDVSLTPGVDADVEIGNAVTSQCGGNAAAHLGADYDFTVSITAGLGLHLFHNKVNIAKSFGPKQLMHLHGDIFDTCIGTSRPHWLDGAGWGDCGTSGSRTRQLTSQPAPSDDDAALADLPTSVQTYSPPQCGTGRCVVPSQLTACPAKVGRPVCAASLDDVAAIDAYIVNATQAAVVEDGTACAMQMREYLCDTQLPECLDGENPDAGIMGVSLPACQALVSQCTRLDGTSPVSCSACAGDNTCPVTLGVDEMSLHVADSGNQGFANSTHAAVEVPVSTLEPSTAGVCVPASGEGFCTGDGLAAPGFWLFEGVFPGADYAQAAAAAMVNNEVTAVATPTCVAAARYLACTNVVPACDPAATGDAAGPRAPCRETCEQTLAACSATAANATTLCADLPSASDKNADGSAVCGFQQFTVLEAMQCATVAAEEHAGVDAFKVDAGSAGVGAAAVVGVAALVAVLAAVVYRQRSKSRAALLAGPQVLTNNPVVGELPA